MADEKKTDEQKDEVVAQEPVAPRDQPQVDRDFAAGQPDAHVEPAGPAPADGADAAHGADGLEADNGPLAQAAEDGAAARTDPEPKVDAGYAERAEAAVQAREERRPGEVAVVTQEQEVRDVRTDHTP